MIRELPLENDIGFEVINIIMSFEVSPWFIELSPATYTRMLKSLSIHDMHYTQDGDLTDGTTHVFGVKVGVDPRLENNEIRIVEDHHD